MYKRQIFVKDLGKETGRFFKISKEKDQLVVKDQYWTARQLAVLEKTLKSDRVLLTGALGSGKTLIAICRIVAAIERDPKHTLVLYWVVSYRAGDGKDMKLFDKIRSAVASSLSGKCKNVDLNAVLDCRFIGETYVEGGRKSVSYTHLTLPTIYSV